MRSRRRLAAACALLALGLSSLHGRDCAVSLSGTAPRLLPGGFLVRPYLQLGDDPAAAKSGTVRVLWHTDDADHAWALEYQPASSHNDAWLVAPGPRWHRIDVRGVAPHRVYRADLAGLTLGSTFAYRVKRDGTIVFTAEARAPRSLAQPQRFIVFGDCGAGTAEERAIAYQAGRARPDLVVIVGDVVYTRGRIVEYRNKFWPVYDADVASPATGAPLLRSTIVVAAAGNHDVAGRELADYPDGMAYFFYWDQPRNGPAGGGIRTQFTANGEPLVYRLEGPEADRAAFLRSAGNAYPRMTNFSFDYGGAHWTILDSNSYVDWTDRELRAWLERDLAGAAGATWRFVAFHHPPFNSSHAHRGDQRMRVLADVFEAGKVDIVWTGHVHNYQRTRPLTFRPDRRPDGKPVRVIDRIPGRWTLDTNYDGQTHTHPLGVIYITTGAGGANLYNAEQDSAPATWEPYTVKLISRINSLTIADIDGPRLTVRQVSADGEELDRFVVTRDKPESAALAKQPR